MSDKRFNQAERAAWLGIGGNIVLALMKGIIGFLSGSKALIADAANSASDVAGSFAVLIGLKAAKKPPDKDHPYGHGKAEPIAAIIVSILLIIVGFQIGISAVQSLFGELSEAPRWYALVAIAISIIVKEVLFQYKYRLGKKLSSQALIANAWDHRSDVYASSAALIGVGGAVLGGYLDFPMMYYLDPLAGLIVSLLVVYMGYKLVMESIHTTMDHVLHEEDTKEMRELLESIPGVVNVDEFRAREHGHYVIVDVKIGVNPRISVYEGHEIAKRVKKKMMEQFSSVSDVFVHVNPYKDGYAYDHDRSSDDHLPPVLH